MKLDVVFVTYNSSKWIDENINSILKSKYNLKNISLYFYDNNSSDDTLLLLNNNKKKYGEKFNDYVIIEGNVNKGFGYGNNVAASNGKSDYILFLNIDTTIYSDTFSKLEERIKNSDDTVKMWELSQRPYEHPKYYDPITGYTSWASGACVVVDREVFTNLGGFDDRIFMYCEDVELSWNFRSHGYNIRYLFDVIINHYSYTEANEFKENQFIYGFVNNWYLRAKYGKFRNFLRGTIYVHSEYKKGSNLPKSLDIDDRRRIMAKIKKLFFKNLIPFTFKSLFGRKNKSFQPQFINGLDYEVNKMGAFDQIKKIKTNPLVSIIVRTHKRPNVLRENLISLRNQTYKNIEVVVVEDGENTAEEMIKKEFKDLNIKYKATGKKAGRCEVGNLGMDLASGKYLNFLDDDDLFYPDHVETLVTELEYNNYDVVYDTSFETKVDVESIDPYKYDVKVKGLFDFGDLGRFELYRRNLYPIQTVMFKKELYKECGGFDTNIDSLEDWDFWIRLSLRHNFNRVEKTTSIFRTPYNDVMAKDRIKFLQESLDYLRKKFKNYKPELTVEDYFRR